MYLCKYIYICIYIHMFTYTGRSQHGSIFLELNTNVYKYNIHIYIYIIRIYMYIYIYETNIYTCIYIHMYIYIDIRSRCSSFPALIHLLSDAFVAVFSVLLGLVCHIYIWHTHTIRVKHTYGSTHKCNKNIYIYKSVAHE